jgi:hypothetical protein
MGKEKTGQTEKLKYDYNTALESQVQLENGKWYRVTCREFRSFNGPRRLIRYENREPVYEEYNSPLYYWNTNVICKEPIGFGPQFIHNMPRQSNIRPNERHLLKYDASYSTK